MQRFSVSKIVRYLGIATATIALVGSEQAPPANWEMQYLHDDNAGDLTLTALRFPSATRGIAAGYMTKRYVTPLLGPGEKTTPVMLVTSDGGKTWLHIPEAKDIAADLFFLDDSLGWMAGAHGIWKTEESGRSWRRVAGLKGIMQLHFVSPLRGFAVGDHRRALETEDGGATWTPISISGGATAHADSKSAAKSAAKAAKKDATVFNVVEFADANTGLISGNDAPGFAELGERTWADPDGFERDPFVTTTFLVTRDGGKTWTESQATTADPLTRASIAPDRSGLALFESRYLFPWPSEIFHLEIGSTDNTRAYRARNRAITDVLLAPHGDAWLAGFEPVGRVRSPIPGKVKILRSEDFEHWEDTKVDYRAVAHSVMLASPGGDNVWAATDTGMILHFRKP